LGLVRAQRNLGLRFILIAGGVSIGTTASSADDVLKAALQSRYAAIKAAMAVHDGAAVAAILAPRFESVTVAGQSETAAQMVAQVNDLRPDPNRSSTTTLASVVLEGTKAIVQQRYDMKSSKTTADGVDHSVELIALSTDTWARPTNEWLMERTVTNEVSYFLDGRLVAHMPKP
jgi:hypothetical protein